MASTFLWIYTVLLFVGGIIGFKKAGSKASLISGSLSGVIMAGGLLLSASQPRMGFSLAAVVCLLLIGAFAIRLKKTQKFMPSGMLLILSVAACVVAILQVMHS